MNHCDVITGSTYPAYQRRLYNVVLMLGQMNKPAWFINHAQQTHNSCITFVQCRTNVEDVGPTLYKRYTNVVCLLDGDLKKMSGITGDII